MLFYAERTVVRRHHPCSRTPLATWRWAAVAESQISNVSSGAPEHNFRSRPVVTGLFIVEPRSLLRRRTAKSVTHRVLRWSDPVQGLRRPARVHSPAERSDMAIVVLVLWLFTAGAGFYLLVTSSLSRTRSAASAARGPQPAPGPQPAVVPQPAAVTQPATAPATATPPTTA